MSDEELMIKQRLEQLEAVHGEDALDFFSLEVPDIDIEYQTYEGEEDEGCAGGACKI